tara:strand:+ start:368 stop:1414 length:1047 start_codon:yes stop_codon:yes gene_type:complete
MRRNDIDWIRVLALGLLIIYHNVVAFQPWGYKIFFIQNKQSLESLWILMSMINVWRIPILFMISGMGVYFAMRRRNWKQLLKERTIRILIPYIFGFLFICPVNIYFTALFYGKEVNYIPNPGHLWFLGNIFSYVLFLLPFLIYLNNKSDNFLFRGLKWLLNYRFGIICLAFIVAIESILVRPEFFTAYALSSHGYWLGIICFIIGFCLVSMDKVFWKAVEKVRLINLSLGFIFYLVRLTFMFTQQIEGFYWLSGFESMCWMLAIFGYGSIYLNKASSALSYLREAVFPVYIIHLPIQFFLSYLIMPLNISAIAKLVLILVGTFGVSFLFYEMLRRIKWIRPLFGLNLN